MAVTHFNDVPVCGQVAKKNPLQTTGNVDEVTCKKCLKVLSNMDPDTEPSKSKNVQEPVEKKVVSDNPKVEAAIEKDFKEAEEQLNTKKTKLNEIKKMNDLEKMIDLQMDPELDADPEPELDTDAEQKAEAELDDIINSFTEDE